MVFPELNLLWIILPFYRRKTNETMSDDEISVCQYTTRILGWLAHTALSVAALIVAFKSTCNNDGHTLVLSPNVYLKVGAFVGIIDALVSSRWTFDIKGMTQTQAVMHCCGLAFDLTWSVIGSALFFQLSADCEHSPIGAMIFAYLVVKWIYVGFRCLFLISGFTESEDPEFQQKASLIYSAGNSEANASGGYGAVNAGTLQTV
eukprot:CAMPEP_0197026738 /NCGR_PEP_ID=MMETSP1384-20130603/6768_1 /TAXON_ID=29189 /ORGANISM="Ammonia sp." /LENGTH=203 /DNA_ID=CAMNT_0042455459 /DNA_START=1 /DNA_END=612 /DNA_ORIENTATION=-